jgi:hypothetical protein
MSTRLTFPASMFSVACQRCGSTVRKNADSCPTCGADRSAAFGLKRDAASAASKPRGGMFEQTASAPFASAGASMSTSAGASGADTGARSGWDAKRATERIAQKAAEHRAKQIERVEQSARNAYADPRHDPDTLPGSENWTQRKTIIAGAAALVLLAGAVFYFQHDSGDDTAASGEHSVSGAIDSKYGPSTHGTIDRSNAPAMAATSKSIGGSDDMSGVRQSLSQHDLTTARARLKALSAQQQTRPEYASISDELVKRELQRDAALQLARACERTQAWACVQQNASEALSLDGSSIESQAMLERVIEHAGWVGTNPAAAKQALAASTVTNSAKLAAPAPAPAAVAVVPAPAQEKPAAPAQKTWAERRAEKRAAAAAAAAARQAAADEARANAEAKAQAKADADAAAKADKLARAQAATNALTATSTAPQARTTTRIAPAPQQPAAAQASAPKKPQYIGDSQSDATAARGAQYLGQPSAAPSASQNGSAQYIGQPETRTQAAPAPAPAPVPRPPQYIGQTSTTPSTVPHPPANAQATAQPVAQRMPPIIGQGGTQTASAQPTAAPVHQDTDKTEALERAIKQYGWSGSDSMPKQPSQ